MLQNSRLNRLFSFDHRCFDLAIDHGVFHNAEFLAGIEDLPAAVATAVEAGPDAIQLGPGQARLLQTIAGRKPALVLRGDVANVYGPNLPAQLFCMALSDVVEQAVRSDAAALVLNLFHAPGQTELYRQCLANLATVKPQCERYAMPLMVEPLVFEAGPRGSYDSSGDCGAIAALVRQAVELGADLIKSDPPARTVEFHRIVEAAGGIPVLARGGGRMPEDLVFARTLETLEQGASGIVYGRNIIQHPKPKQMTQALMALVHHGAGVEEAMTILRSGPPGELN
jgi:DhnA family fructose-bisphosphate aldolase class Ia